MEVTLTYRPVLAESAANGVVSAMRERPAVSAVDAV